jgi:hypothetical protein
MTFNKDNSNISNLLEELAEFAFAHEYALINFSESDLVSDKEKCLQDMESYKALYYHVRKKIMKISPQKLSDLETSLLEQKSAFFASNHSYLH